MIILNEGVKISLSGLYNHEEKVRPIAELWRNTRLSELQTFLSMVVYFIIFIL